MNLKRGILKGGAVLGLTQVVGQLCSLGRNIIIARIVSPADFGISAIFVMVVAFLEMISSLSLDRLLIQATDGNEPKFQQVAQFLQASRGVIIFLLLFFSAGFLANLFSIPEATGAFSALAFIPLLNGFRHLDPKRMERKLCFWPGASVELVSQIVVLVLVWPVGQWLGDYRAMLVLLLVKSLIIMVGTQLVAERNYGWAQDQEYIKRFISFGWPLLINGLLLFAILQGDRFIIGSAKKLFGADYNMIDVGLYSAAVMLTMIPAMMFNRVSSSLLLPLLSSKRDSDVEFFAISRSFGEGITIVASMTGVMFVLLGDKILPYVYGEHYQHAGTLTAWLGIVWALRMMRVLPSSIAMAKGETKILMNANFVRILSLAGVLYIVLNGMDIVFVAIVGILGEVAAYLFGVLLNISKLKTPYRIYFRSIIAFVICVVSSLVVKYYILVQSTEVQWLHVSVTIFICFISLIVFLRSSIQRVFNKG